jgi:hypothetical protein
VGPGPFWTGAENHALTGIRSPDFSARSESLYRLSCRGPRKVIEEKKSILPAGIETELVLKNTKKNKDVSDTENSEIRNTYLLQALSIVSSNRSPVLLLSVGSR